MTTRRCAEMRHGGLREVDVEEGQPILEGLQDEAAED
jgi:hypothetical protein